MATTTSWAPKSAPSMWDVLDRRWEEFMLSYNSLGGKDKMFRSFCYLFQFLSGTIETRYKAGTPEAQLGARLRAIEGALSTFRQGFRVLSYHTQWRTFLVEWAKFRQSPSLLSFLSAAKTFTMFPYYIVDNIAWLAKIDVIGGDKVGLARRAIAWWFVSLILAVLSDTLTLLNAISAKNNFRISQWGGSLIQLALAAIEVETASSSSSDQSTSGSASAPLVVSPTSSASISSVSSVSQSERRAAIESKYASDLKLLVLNYLKNGGDMVLALSTLRYDFSRPVTGASGSLSSFIGWYLVWPTLPSK